MPTTPLQVARTGLDAQNTRMRIIANNLANVNTTAFKRDRAAFETLAYQAERQPGAQSTNSYYYATGLTLGSGVQTIATERQETEGSLVNTGNALDLAVSGVGFFQIQLPDGTIGYTRAGNFQLSQDGQIVTDDGKPLIPNINIPQNAEQVTIGEDGTVSVQLQGQTQSNQVGQIQTVRFINPAGLQATGQNLYIETQSSGQPQIGLPQQDGMGYILQGELEQSNVNIVQELVDMIETQRAYEVNSKMIKASDEMLQYINQQIS
ncbi:MAG: flagellar basal-body rod protein FlgG [Zymomonas mobilis]|uniref:Flagellar basal-body rod protein FlgG n=1 Tax=Zymomonas mobilis TaxID=542 RepID=A0A542W0G3_ZYMMB|nr:flagellar basal-body rod protein FlgG [Zymomonas mobilis]TQL17078.1 flagellar basal-body rod protein FlgG [Zymomonas mobilis]